MEQAYFTGIKNKIIPLIDGATNNLKIAMAWFTNGDLFASLIRSLNRGLKVELILLDDSINFMDYAPDFNQFIKEGGKLKIAKSDVGFMHHKFCIIDNKIVITGSYNWTFYAETRNIENIIISDKSETVNLYRDEFSRLSDKLTLSNVCPRISWDEIESRSNVDFDLLNYEIEQICKTQQMPIKRVFNTKTEVIRTEIKFKPYSRYAIGVSAFNKDLKETFNVHIKANELLPYTTNERILYLDTIKYKTYPCSFIYGNPNNLEECNLIRVVNLLDITDGIKDKKLEIKFTMTLDDNGSLRIYITCIKTGKVLIASDLNKNFVKYV